MDENRTSKDQLCAYLERRIGIAAEHEETVFDISVGRAQEILRALRAAPEPAAVPPPPYPGDDQAVRDAELQLPNCLCDRGRDDATGGRRRWPYIRCRPGA